MFANPVVTNALCAAMRRSQASAIEKPAPAAYGLMKQNLDRALRNDLETCLEHEAKGIVASVGTQDHREAVRAFVDAHM